MDQLPENEKQKRIEIRKFFVPDEISERQMIPKLCDQNIFIEEPTTTATATVTMSEVEIENIVNEPAGTKRKADNVISDDGNTKKNEGNSGFYYWISSSRLEWNCWDTRRIISIYTSYHRYCVTYHTCHHSHHRFNSYQRTRARYRTCHHSHHRFNS